MTGTEVKCAAMKPLTPQGFTIAFFAVSYTFCFPGVTVSKVTQVQLLPPNITKLLNLSRAEIKRKWARRYDIGRVKPPQITILDIVKGQYMKVARRTLIPSGPPQRTRPAMVPLCGGHSSLNLTHVPYRGFPKVVPTWELGLKTAVCIALDIFAFLGNIIIILVVINTKKMRTTTNYYIVNLACSDLLVACGPIWIHLVDDITEGWQLGYVLCKFSAFLQITAMCASVFTLMAIAGDRFFAIMFPLKSRVTQRKVSFIAAIIWMSAAAIGSPLLFVYTYEERQWKDHLERFCSDVWPLRNGDEVCGITSKKVFWTFVCLVLNWIPMFVMTIIYTVIVCKLRFNRIVPNSGILSYSAVQNRSKRKVVKMLFSVLIVFMVCTVPFQVSKLFELYRLKSSLGQELPSWYNSVYFAAIVLMYANSALNPVIYGGLNENFRKGFWAMVRCEKNDRGSMGPNGLYFNMRHNNMSTSSKPGSMSQSRRSELKTEETFANHSHHSEGNHVAKYSENQTPTMI